MFRTLKATAVAATLAIGVTALAPATAAHAGGSFEIGIGFGDAYGGYRRARRDRHARRGGRCRPHRALRKARRLGVRRAYVHRFGRRGLVVRGRSYGDRVMVRFGRARHCPVIALRRR